jgi:hypothetical protein
LLDYFWQGIIVLQVAFAGLDRMMTGVVKPNIERQTFLTYVLWFTLTNQAVAYLVTSTYWSATVTPNPIVAALIWITVTWTWIGGTLDFLYWMMAGRVPEWEKVLWWMPLKPKLWQWGIYTICWLITLTATWNLLI